MSSTEDAIFSKWDGTLENNLQYLLDKIIQENLNIVKRYMLD